MADVVILAGGDPTTVDSTGYFYMDATRIVSPQFSSEVSSYPVQRSGDVSDNVSNRNITITVEGVISNHFLPKEARKGSPDETKDVIGFTSNRVSKAIGILQDYWHKKKFITLVMEHIVAENCILKEFSYDITVQSSEALDVRMTFEQLRVTTAERVITYDVIPAKKAEAVDSKGSGTVSKTEEEDSFDKLSDDLSKDYVEGNIFSFTDGTRGFQ